MTEKNSLFANRRSIYSTLCVDTLYLGSIYRIHSNAQYNECYISIKKRKKTIEIYYYRDSWEYRIIGQMQLKSYNFNHFMIFTFVIFIF